MVGGNPRILICCFCFLSWGIANQSAHAALVDGGSTGEAVRSAIDGSGTPQAIDGSGIPLAIDGSGIPLAIDGSGKPIKSGPDDVFRFSSDALILSKGPIKVRWKNLRTIEVLGKSVSVSPALHNVIRARPEDSDWILVGSFGAQGKLEISAAFLLSTPYVPGSSKVIASGRVSQVFLTTATLFIGRQRVDFAQTISGDSQAEPTKGDFIQVTGTQPNRDGLIIAETLRQQ